MVTVRAVYKDGAFHPLDPVDVKEGEQVQLRLLSERDLVEMALADLLVPRPPLDPDEEEIDEEAVMQELWEATKGIPPTSQVIINERQEGP